jgi:hypothetical protein
LRVVILAVGCGSSLGYEGNMRVLAVATDLGIDFKVPR